MKQKGTNSSSLFTLFSYEPVIFRYIYQNQKLYLSSQRKNLNFHTPYDQIQREILQFHSIPVVSSKMKSHQHVRKFASSMTQNRLSPPLYCQSIIFRCITRACSTRGEVRRGPRTAVTIGRGRATAVTTTIRRLAVRVYVKSGKVTIGYDGKVGRYLSGCIVVTIRQTRATRPVSRHDDQNQCNSSQRRVPGRRSRR